MGLKKKIASLGLAAFLGMQTLMPIEAKADFKKEQGIVLGGNMVIGCLISGIGSRYHKNWFWKGCYKGLIGGAVMYGGKEIARHTEYDSVPFLGKLVHSAGVSMRDNVSKGKGIFDEYQIDFGPVLFGVNKDKNFDAYFLPGATIDLVYNIAIGQEFNLEKTLSYGTPVFDLKNKDIILKYIGDVKTNNFTRTNNIIITQRHMAAHELTHALQYREGTYLDQIIESDSLVGKLKYIKLGPDANNLILWLMELPMDYKDRPQEFEAYKGYSK